ncbi:zinc-dependent metalloprotease [Haloechinothrix sp. LS1_15]|uniref:zinc-dependent metalloprotease n=1 Tax=Haloechinothrix sp. LS1_15 TaxID=2652248 RepID=UPI002947C998|nr:zinc-dependent metalloprotease [Haloechinothrix sp. LS1_15]MDV6011415.1 coenzyme F420 biosynthesis-associated protein [Haloechinothrix sp. LS1_15]
MSPSSQSSSESGSPSDRVPVDWSIAATTGTLLVGNGPNVSRAEADRAVAQLAELSIVAEGHVRELTGLGAHLPLVAGTVVDRRAWVRAAAAGLGALTGTAQGEVGKRSDQHGPLRSLLAGGAGVQTGLALAFLGSKVLGQFDPFGTPGDGGTDAGRLLLVAPNVIQAERAMGVASDDFRMWVCLHESTHRLQFTAIEWLREYFATEVGRFIAAMDDTTARSLGRLPEAIRQARSGTASPLGLAEALQSPEQRQAFDRLIALATLLEGHADYVMDAVGPEVVPSVATIRRKFTERRKGGGLLDRLLRSLLGIDAKIKQYEQGAAFTRHVVDRVGMSGFNAVWQSPETLPARGEFSEPDAWLRRVHG